MEFENGKVTFFDGNYEEYTRHKEDVTEEEEELVSKRAKVNLNNENVATNQMENKKENNINRYLISKQNNKIKNKMDKLEKDIEEKEKKIKEIEVEMQKEDISTDYIKLSDLQQQITVLHEEIDSKMEEWEILSSQYVDLE